MNNPHQISTIYSAKSYVFYTLIQILLSICIAYLCWALNIIKSSNISIILLTLDCWMLWETSMAMLIVMAHCSTCVTILQLKIWTNYQHWTTNLPIRILYYNDVITDGLSYGFNCNVRFFCLVIRDQLHNLLFWFNLAVSNNF